MAERGNLNIELDRELLRRIKVAAAEQGTFLRRWVELAILEKLKKAKSK